MKTKLFIIVLTMLIFNCKNHTVKDKNTLEFDGIYNGIIPCADCDGIKTTLILSINNTYSKTVQYLGKETTNHTNEGEFTWNTNGSIITIYSNSGEKQMYLVGENVLYHLDKKGNKIDSNLSERYKLFKNDLQ